MNKLGKRPLGNADTKFHASEPSGSEEKDFIMYFYAFLWFSGIVTDFGPSTNYISEDFLIFFMYFYGLSLGPPGGRAIFKPGIFI